MSSVSLYPWSFNGSSLPVFDVVALEYSKAAFFLSKSLANKLAIEFNSGFVVIQSFLTPSFP